MNTNDERQLVELVELFGGMLEHLIEGKSTVEEIAQAYKPWGESADRVVARIEKRWRDEQTEKDHFAWTSAQNAWNEDYAYKKSNN